jgi:hypothetical protein
MKRVLIVAYYFPPAGGVGSLRVTAFARHLPEFGWDPVVLAPRDPAYQRDPELTFPEERVIRTGSFELSRAAKQALRTGGTDTTAAQVSGIHRFLQASARKALYYPDAQIGWYAPALLAARRTLAPAPVDAIFSSSFPITAHLVARRLHRSTKAPWLAEFRDPWSLTLPGRSFARRRATRLERSIARAADIAATVSPSWAQLFERHWGRPVRVLPNGQGLTDRASPPSRAPSDEPAIGYVGTYYPHMQHLDAAWAAISRSETPFRVRLIGAANDVLAQQLATHGLGARLDVTGFLSHDAALQSLETCSIALVAGPADATGLLRGQVAGKIWEYLATDLPIVYVGDPACDAADVLREYEGCWIHGPDDVDGITATLRAANGHRFARDASQISRRARTRQLASLLDELVG